jgi:hypothetical protein
MREQKKAKFETGDNVRPVSGLHKGEIGIIKEVHDMILTPNALASYKVRFDVKSQFGYSDYEYGWYAENELMPNVIGAMGFSMEGQCTPQ